MSHNYKLLSNFVGNPRNKQKLDSEEDKSRGKGAGNKFTAEKRGEILSKHSWPSQHVLGYFASEFFLPLGCVCVKHSSVT